MSESLKKIADRVPYFVGKLMAKTPMRLRLGPTYDSFQDEAMRTRCINELKKIHYQKVKKLLLFSFEHIKFYKEFYEENNFKPESVSCFDELELIPVVTKVDLQTCPLEGRSSIGFSMKKSNTGGTSGQPLDFYLEKNAYAREWAHMHIIWGKLGYRYTDRKITIRGKNIGNRYYKYNFNQNEFLINAYAPLQENLAVCRELILKKDIEWIHGYPSSVFNFLRELESTDANLFSELISKVKGVFLGSEYPAPQYRSYIEQHCGLKSISWYGHSEMAVLAPEKVPGSGVYFPFQSYGFAEALPVGDSHRLIATSTHNFATPLIRYDTGDLITPHFKDGLLESFTIKEGRNSDSVIDCKGRSISLTGLIFGRHHRAFDHCEHIQVMQLAPGKIEVLITSREHRNNWSELFDFSNALFEVSFRKIEFPVTTSLGKVKLLLN
jgi:phenylacetate-CoA ligase